MDSIKTVVLDSGHLVLTRKEFQLLAMLVQHAGDIIHGNAAPAGVGIQQEIRTRT